MRHARLALLAASILVPAGCGEKVAPPPPQPSHWYSGGTVHNADAKRWGEVTDQNRLATCADLVTRRLMAQGANPSTLDVERLKPWAIELKDCITRSYGEGAEGRVPDVAGACLDGMAVRWPP